MKCEFESSYYQMHLQQTVRANDIRVLHVLGVGSNTFKTLDLCRQPKAAVTVIKAQSAD